MTWNGTVYANVKNLSFLSLRFAFVFCFIYSSWNLSAAMENLLLLHVYMKITQGVLATNVCLPLVFQCNRELVKISVIVHCWCCKHFMSLCC